MKPSGNILAVDFGTKDIGLAIYRLDVGLVLPYALLANDHKLVSSLTAIVEEEEIKLLLFGIPYMADGKSTRMGATIKKFAQNFAALVNVAFQDETYSTVTAQAKIGKHSPHLDEMAATIILQDYLQGLV